MDIKFFVGPNGAGKSFNLKRIYNESENSLYVNEEGQPTFSISKPRVKIDIENNMYHFHNDLQRGINSQDEPVTEKINEEFLPLLHKALELQKKNEIAKSAKSKGQEKFSNLLTIFTEYNFNNLEYICLDEPENFMDEDYIKLIARFILKLAEVGFKVRVATHSVRILTECNASIEQIGILNRTIEYKTSISRIKEVMKNTRDEIMKFQNKDFNLGGSILSKLNVWDNKKFFKVFISQTIENEDFYKCLFNKTIILVEGASEIIALKTIKNRFDSSTEFFSPHGKVYMPFFVKLFNSLGKDIIVLIDTDKEDNKMPWVLTKYFKDEKEKNKLNLITHEPDFEEYYGIPWREISRDIGYQNKRLTGDLKPIVSMIFFDEPENQQLLFDKICKASVENDSKYGFV